MTDIAPDAKCFKADWRDKPMESPSAMVIAAVIAARLDLYLGRIEVTSRTEEASSAQVRHIL